MQQVLQRGKDNARVAEIEEGGDADKREQQAQLVAGDRQRVPGPGRQQANRRDQRVGGRVALAEAIGEPARADHQKRRGQAGDEPGIEPRLAQAHAEAADHQRGEEDVEAETQRGRERRADHQLACAGQQQQAGEDPAERRHLVAGTRIVPAAWRFGHHQPGDDGEHEAGHGGDQEYAAPIVGLGDPATADEADERAERRRQHQHRDGQAPFVDRKKSAMTDCSEGSPIASPRPTPMRATSSCVQPAAVPHSAVAAGHSNVPTVMRPRRRTRPAKRATTSPKPVLRTEKPSSGSETCASVRRNSALHRLDQHVADDPVDKADRADGGDDDERRPRGNRGAW